MTSAVTESSVGMPGQGQPILRNKHYAVARSVSSVFTDREKIVTELTEYFMGSETQQGGKVQKRFVLHGLGGIGKSQICLKFVQNCRERYVSFDRYKVFG